jgi:hypothetical protein
MVGLMRWDRHSWMAVGGIAVLVLGGAMLLADTSEAFARGRHGAPGPNSIALLTTNCRP